MARWILKRQQDRIRRPVAGALFVALAGLGGSATAALATVRAVPESYPTIQAAIDASASGDTVLLSPGTYRGAGNRSIEFRGRDIVLTSRDGPEATIIDCEQAGGGFYIHEGETRQARIRGVTVSNGNAAAGGGLRFMQSDPIVENCRIVNNYARVSGGGVDLLVSDALFDRCVISGNSCSSVGGGLVIDFGTPQFVNCLISGNTARDGGGVCFPSGGNHTLSGCTIVGNQAEYGGGLRSWTRTTLERCIVRDNCAWEDGDDLLGLDLILVCCAVDSTRVIGPTHYDDHCVFADPLFCGPYPCGWTTMGDWTLNANSPCLPEHSPCGELIGGLWQGCGGPPPTGACCFPDGSCRVLTNQECGSQQGRYMGDGSFCEPNPCQPTPAGRMSWGRIKAAFR
jgi:hypothetical protein